MASKVSRWSLMRMLSMAGIIAPAICQSSTPLTLDIGGHTPFEASEEFNQSYTQGVAFYKSAQYSHAYTFFEKKMQKEPHSLLAITGLVQSAIALRKDDSLINKWAVQKNATAQLNTQNFGLILLYIHKEISAKKASDGALKQDALKWRSKANAAYDAINQRPANNLAFLSGVYYVSSSNNLPQTRNELTQYLKKHEKSVWAMIILAHSYTLGSFKASYWSADGTRGSRQLPREQWPNYDRAKSLLDKAITIDGRIWIAYYYRGHCSHYLKRTDLAISDFKKALSLGPNNERVVKVMNLYIKSPSEKSLYGISDS